MRKKKKKKVRRKRARKVNNNKVIRKRRLCNKNSNKLRDDNCHLCLEHSSINRHLPHPHRDHL